jgi:2-C-methyl-D-erythritol 4-phosphate cytidylyltransferase
MASPSHERMVNEQSSLKQVVCVVLAAGQGTRMGSSINKVLLPINGKPVIIYAIETFERCSAVDEILLVAAVGEEERLAAFARDARCHKVREVIHGGATRHASEQCALEALRARITRGEVELVLIHDGARPFVAVEEVEQLIRKAREVGGAILAAPLQAGERLVQVDSKQSIQRSFEGRLVWKAQTPQVFQASLLLAAYDQADRDQFYGTDTASSVERIGGRVAVVEGDSSNLKITTTHDLLLAEKLCRYRPNAGTSTRGTRKGHHYIT